MNLAQIPQGDFLTYKMIQAADTVGVFQIESRAQMALLPRMKPSKFYDLVIEVAIVRPGPIKGGMVHPFIQRRHGLQSVHYPHPNLKPILEKTMGVPIFQEQIMQMASAVAGFTPGESDELRRIMSSSWKRKDVMGGVRKRLLSGMLSNGISMKYAEQIYQTIEGFASYGFPESHAASFALLTYASCYIKKHHPEIFCCALLNSQPMGFYSPRSLISDAQRHGVRFLEIDIQHSNYDYSLENPRYENSEDQDLYSIRQGLRAVRSLRQEHAESIVFERQQNGCFKDLEDFVKRTHLPRSSLMTLGAAGAFKSFGLKPREAIWRIQSLSLDHRSLFYAKGRESLIHSEPSQYDFLPRETNWQKLEREYDWTGYSIDQHPLGLLRPLLNEWSKCYKNINKPGFSSSDELKQLHNGHQVRVAGLVGIHQRPPTAKGMSFITLEDETGFLNIVLDKITYQKHRLTLSHSLLLEVYGRLEKHQGVINIKASHLRSLPLQ